jgi:hypothetical protein
VVAGVVSCAAALLVFCLGVLPILEVLAAPTREGVPDGVPVSVSLPDVVPLPEPATEPVCWDASETMRAPCPQEGDPAGVSGQVCWMGGAEVPCREVAS